MHVRSCRCKNLKQVSGLIGGFQTPQTLPLDLLLFCGLKRVIAYWQLIGTTTIHTWQIL